MRDDESLILGPAAAASEQAAGPPGTAPGHGATPGHGAGTAPGPGTALGPGTEHRPQLPLPWVRRLVLVALVLAALNLRPAITSLGALLKEVRDGLGMSGTMAGLLTSVPAACFALFGFAAPRLARRFGPGAVVCAGMAAITGGLVLRPLAGGTAVFLATSALALAGIAVSNVLMPVMVKRYFPDRVGTVTGVYSMALSLGTSVAAAVTVPLTDTMGGSWRAGLGVWAALAAVAVGPWLPLVRDRSGQRQEPRTGSVRSGAAPATGAPAAEPSASAARPAAPAPAHGERGRIGRSRTARMLAGYFGLQSTAAYVTMGWMPQIFRDAGLSADKAGLLLAVTMALGVPLSFVLPPLAARMRSQGPIVVALAVFQLAGFAGLWAAPAAAPWVWAVLLGFANCAFPLVLTMIGMRARSGAGVVRLSAFAQSTGYLLSIPGPILVGALNQASGGWGLPMALMLVLVVPQVACGVLAGRNRHVEDEL
ncbi:putative transmembrane transport protein [Actinacidiphila reveromycinica]|uniref:Putative transmembrane transport protein n=1 Tax=Actinacidiphila reveromycinica TaxID=659352 RepID=A0A7U3UQ07_9ACTN|nr:MFS transporter [Streptomyces sp. SN-593]BBA96541.1 putative transmembrane transport protein [Streptomyces sp. SN-593]